MLKTVGFPSTRTGDQTIIDGNLVIGTSGKGIDFSATPGTGTSELLADYEEGTFTPALTFGGGSTSITYGSRYGYYVKIGAVVYYFISFQLSNKGSSTGDAVITGLPFTSSSSTGLFPDGTVRAIAALTFTAPVYGTVLRATTTLAMLNNVLGSQAALTHTAFANNTELAITGFYFA